MCSPCRCPSSANRFILSSDHSLGLQSTSQLPGHVRIASADPLANPKIACNYLSTDADRHAAVEGLRMTRQITAAQPWPATTRKNCFPARNR